jgi:Ni,Fe-hydrogenase III large subunit
MARYDFENLNWQERLYVAKAIHATDECTVDANDFDITLTIDGHEVDFLAFSRSMIEGVSDDLDERARELVRDKLDKMQRIIHELADLAAAGL